jgi:hypothetical protein
MLVAMALSGSAAYAQVGATCTEVIGFSQTDQWYEAGFISGVPDAGAWQIRWTDGASIDRWADTTDSVWDLRNLVSHCRQSSSAPDLVVLNVSGDYHAEPTWWTQQTARAIANVRAKYPGLRQIALQPVVGGPSGTVCGSRTDNVRASFNYPYIKQGIQALLGDAVVLGASPEVRSCNDYTDNIGHLHDSARQYVGAAVAQFYTRGAPLPPVSVAPATVPVLLSEDAVFSVSFDDLPNPNRALTGQYPDGLIDWTDGAWLLSGPFDHFSGNSVSFSRAGPTSAAIALAEGVMLLQLDADNGGSSPSTVTSSCEGQPDATLLLNSHQASTLATGWSAPCTAITISSSNGWDTNFRNFILR